MTNSPAVAALVNDESIWDSTEEDESVVIADHDEVAINGDQERGNEGLNPNNNNNNEWSYDVNSVPCLSFNKDVIVYDKRQNIPQHSSRSSLYKINEADNTSDAHLSRHNDLENKPADCIHDSRDALPYCQPPHNPVEMDCHEKMHHLEKNYIHSSWNCYLNSSQIEYLPIPDAKMEPIAERAHNKIHHGLREACLALGIVFTTITLICIELLRIITLTIVKPFLQFLRFLSHLIINYFCDISYILSAHWERFIYPIINSWAAYSQDVVVPVIREFRPIHIIVQQQHHHQPQHKQQHHNQQQLPTYSDKVIQQC
uniref:Uncharacterized protein n=1 Tax=Trichobilharzia regenti TaxID=157069 RepID=A0AA85K7F2_TRIRE|nr:unnamed protein product [Trichobilharzia regenti]